MRIAWRSLLLFALLTGTAIARDQIRIEASLDTDTQTITGVMEVIWHNSDSTYADPHFRLYANFEPKHPIFSTGEENSQTVIDSVYLSGRRDSVERSVSGTDLGLTLGPEYFWDSTNNITRTRTISLFFSTKIGDGGNRLGQFPEQYNLDGWFPMPAPFRDGRWMVVPYDDETELVGDFYDFDVSFSYPSNLTCIAPGRYGADTSESAITDHFRLTPAHDFVLLLGTGFKRKEYFTNGIRVPFYYRSRNDAAVDSTAQSVLFTLDWMAEHVGPYPFDELVIAQTEIGFSGGIEFPQMYWQSNVSSGEYLRFSREVAIHETLHQWFYGFLASNQAEDPFLDESITEYFSERISDAETNRNASLLDAFGFAARSESYSRLIGHNFLDKLPITRSALAYSRREYTPVIYGKGAMVMRTITRLMGDAGDDFWKAYYQQFLFKHPTQPDFVALANQFAPFAERRNVGLLLNSATALDYRIDEVESEELADSGQVRSTIRFTAQHPLPYPVQVRLEFPADPAFDTTLLATPGEQQFEVVRHQPVTVATLDPNYQYAIDVNYLNNSLSRSSHGAAFRLFSGITFLVESLFSIVGGI